VAQHTIEICVTFAFAQVDEEIWTEASADVQLFQRFRTFQEVSRGIDVSTSLGSHLQF